MEKLFLSVLNMSLTGAFVIAAIMLARLPLKKAPKAISYSLWTVAGFRLIFPFSIQSVLSLLPFKAAPIPQDIAMQAVPRFNSGVTAIDNAISAILPAAAPAASANPLQLWQFVGAYIWLFGIAVMLIYSAISIAFLQHRLRGAAHVECNLYEADNLKTPFVLGLFRPKIYLPSGLSMDERRYIILHERTHIRRCDHIVKMLAYFALCLHWFNPLVWAAFVLMGADMEMSCDERVMRELGSDIKTAYSLSLVRVAAGHRILNGSPLAFGEGGMKERVKNVLNFKKHSRVMIIAAIALAAVVITGFALNKTTEARKTPGIYQPQVWLDYYLSKEFPSGDTTAGRTFPEFPGVEFIWTPGKLVAKDSKGERELLFGMPIWNIYMADLTGDGLPEFCATVSFGSGVIDNHIVVYDYAADQTYTLSDRMYYDYALFLDHTRLAVMQTKYPNPKGDVLATGELAIVNGELVAIGIPNDAKSLTEQRQSRLTAYLSDLFTTAYAPYYEGLRYEVSGYEEVTDASGNYSATFLWTMHHKGNGLDVPSDLGKEQEVNFLLQATAKLDAESLPDLSTIEILADGSATGARDYRVPIVDFFPDGKKAETAPPKSAVPWPDTQTYEARASLHKGMPEYRFVATGYQTDTQDWHTGYVLGLDGYDENGSPILSADFSRIEEGKVVGNYVYNQMMDTMGLHVVDVNFDGYKDVIILSDFSGAHSNTWYYCWLWDEKTSSFITSKSFADICNPALDPEEKCIYSTGGSGAAFWGGYIYKFIDGEFVVTNELDTNEHGLVERELVNGDMEVVREATYYFDEKAQEKEREYYRTSKLWQLDNPHWYWYGGHHADPWLE